MVFRKDGDKLLTSLGIKNNIDLDKLISAYLIVGDDLAMLLHIFEGQTITFPSKRRLGCMNLHNINFIEDDDKMFSDYKRKQIVEYKGKEYTVIAEEKKILNHYYLPVVPLEEDKDEQ